LQIAMLLGLATTYPANWLLMERDQERDMTAT
jgi:hypothetical protein